MAGKEKWFDGCFSFLSAGLAGVILVWVPGAAFHLPTHHFAHTDILQKAICLFKEFLHKKDWRSIIWGYFQPFLWSSLTWSHTEAKAGTAIILPPYGMSVLLMLSWSDLCSSDSYGWGQLQLTKAKRNAQKNAQTTTTSSAAFSVYSQQGNEFLQKINAKIFF